MAKKVIRVKTNTKVVKASKSGPVKPKFRQKSPGFLTDKIVATVNSKKKK